MVGAHLSVIINTTLMTRQLWHYRLVGTIELGGRCLSNITISANGRSVNAMVVDECDSTMGCDKDHDYQPPCANNIVDASRAAWKALGVPEDNWGKLNITWSDA